MLSAMAFAVEPCVAEGSGHAVGRFVMRTKEYVACIRPLARVLVLHTMYLANELRRPEAVVDLPARTTVSARELAMAAELISSLSGILSRERKLRDLAIATRVPARRPRPLAASGPATSRMSSAASPSVTVVRARAMRAAARRPPRLAHGLNLEPRAGGSARGSSGRRPKRDQAGGKWTCRRQ
jgi:hypothetical protein